MEASVFPNPKLDGLGPLRYRCTIMSDTSLRSYRAKRNFAVTTEPPPREVANGPKALFVVQKHTAHRARLHWDFRLEHGGVLWSWAVPKGPSLDPADRRMGRWCTRWMEGEMTPAPVRYATTRWQRTDFGRPVSSIRFRTVTPMAASACWAAKPRARSRGPISAL